MADKLKALKKENKELKKLLAKAKELLLTYHDILKQPANPSDAVQNAEKRRSVKKQARTTTKTAKRKSRKAPAVASR